MLGHSALPMARSMKRIYETYNTPGVHACLVTCFTWKATRPRMGRLPSHRWNGIQTANCLPTMQGNTMSTQWRSGLFPKRPVGLRGRDAGPTHKGLVERLDTLQCLPWGYERITVDLALLPGSPIIRDCGCLNEKWANGMVITDLPARIEKDVSKRKNI
jgi:hypothetical protein